MTIRISSRDWEDLSTYLDGELTPTERSRLESRLEVSAEMRAALEEMRRTRQVLRNQPRVRAPRNFTLTPQMVGIRTEKSPAFRLFPVMRLTAVLASLLFVFMMVGEFFWLGQNMAAPMLGEESAPLMAQEMGDTVAGEVSEAVVEKAIPEGELEEPMALEVEPSLDVASEPDERAPAMEMPMEEAEGYQVPTAEAPFAAAPPAPLVGVEATSMPSALESLQPVEEIEIADELPESGFTGVRAILYERQILRLVEMVLLLVGVTTGFMAFLLRPKRSL
jgi:hypothetical protein